MIIGLNGLPGSGKDTFYDIVYKHTLMDDVFSPWENKKFAKKLKEIVAILLGVPVEKLEDPQYKETILPESWWFWKTKDGIFPYSKQKVEDKNYWDVKGVLIRPTPRYLLRNIGTDLFRNQLHPDIWVNALMSEYDDYYCYGPDGKKEPCSPDWVITDVRFPNEAKAIKDRGGIIIHIKRDGCHGTHESDTALDDWKFDVIIENNKSLKDFEKNVELILEFLGIKS